MIDAIAVVLLMLAGFIAGFFAAAMMGLRTPPPDPGPPPEYPVIPYCERHGIHWTDAEGKCFTCGGRYSPDNSDEL